MDNVIIEQIKKFIKCMKASDSLANLRKDSCAEGYMIALDAVGAIIAMGEYFQKESEVKSG